MAHLQANGISIYYEVHGQGEPLILISGLGGDHSFWQSSMPVLAASFQVVVFDTRGIGETDAPSGDYTMELFADDLAGLMDALQLDKAHILGFSMGGAIAQAFALKYPERVSKLILAASFAVQNHQVRLFLDAVLSVYEQGASTKQMFDLIAPWLFSARFLSNPDNAAYVYYDENEPNPQPLYAWKAQFMAQQQFNCLSLLDQIKATTLLMAGGQDRLAHVEDSELMADKISHSILRIIPDSGHLINYEQPDLFHQYILDFLTEETRNGGHPENPVSTAGNV